MTTEVPPDISDRTGSRFERAGIKTSRVGGTLRGAGSKIKGAVASPVNRTVAVAAAGGAAVGGLASGAVRGVVSTAAGNAFLIFAAISKIVDGYLTDWNFGVNDYTIRIDLAMLLYAIVQFKRDQLDKVIWGFLAFLGIIGYLMPQIQQLASSIGGGISASAILFLICIAFIVTLHKMGDSEIAFIGTIFLLEIGFSSLYTNFTSFFDANPEFLIGIYFPFWMLAGVKYSETRVAAVMFVIMSIFIIMWFPGISFGAIDAFQTNTEISSDLKDDAQGRLDGVKAQFGTILDSLRCGWVVIWENDNSCYETLKKKNEKNVVVEDDLKIEFNPISRPEVQYLGEKKVEYSMLVKIKNELDDELKVHLTCGTSTAPKEISESDEQSDNVVITENPITVARGKKFERRIKCVVPEQPSVNRPIIFFRARMQGLESETTFKRLMINRDTGQDYTKIISQKYGPKGHLSKPEKGFAHMDLSVDRPELVMVLPRDQNTFNLFPAIVNNGDGKITLKSAQITLPDGLTTEPCGKASAGKNIVLDPHEQPWDEIRRGDYMAWQGCSVRFDPDANMLNPQHGAENVVPKMHIMEGKIKYDYMVTAYSNMQIQRSKNQKKNDTLLVT